MKNHWLDKKKNETPEQADLVITGDNEWVMYEQNAEYKAEEIIVTQPYVGDITIGDGVYLGADPCGSPICISGTPEINITSEIPKEIKIHWDYESSGQLDSLWQGTYKVYTRTLKLGAFEFKDDGEFGFGVFVNNVFTASIPYDVEEALFNWLQDKLRPSFPPINGDVEVLPGAQSLDEDFNPSPNSWVPDPYWVSTSGHTIELTDDAVSPSKFTVHYDEPEHLNVCKDIGISKRQLLKDIKLYDEAKKDIDNLVKAEIDDAIIEDIKQNAGIIIESESDHKLYLI